MANGFVEVSGYSATDLANARTAGYNECKEDLTTLTVEENGTYTAEGQGVVGWDRVEVEAQADLFHRLITANGDYDAEEDGHQGYSSVTVAVPGGGGGGPFTVRFFADDRQTILKTEVNVPYGGNASCTELDGTIIGGQYFKGWNPAPTNVKQDLNCYPVRGDYIVNHQETLDSWETVCADCGAHYPLGTYHSFVFNIPQEDYHSTMVDSRGYTRPIDERLDPINVAMDMVKVAEGEDGTTSTWISTGGVRIKGAYETFGSMIANGVVAAQGQFEQTYTDWGNIPVRKYLNEHFITYLPQCLQDTIKQVNKSYAGLSSYSPTGSRTKVEKTSLDKIWLPSIAEFWTLLSNRTGNPSAWGYPSAVKESTGIDYTEVYVPTYLGRHGFRSVYSNYNAYGVFQPFYLTIDDSNNPNGYSGEQTFVYLPIGFCL